MFEAILAPFRWLMSWLLGAFHTVLEFAGMPADSGWTWALSILLLVVLIRTLLIPPQLAYGNVARASIPAGSTLHFTIELVKLSKGKLKTLHPGLKMDL